MLQVGVALLINMEAFKRYIAIIKTRALLLLEFLLVIFYFKNIKRRAMLQSFALQNMALNSQCLLQARLLEKMRILFTKN